MKLTTNISCVELHYHCPDSVCEWVDFPITHLAVNDEIRIKNHDNTYITDINGNNIIRVLSNVTCLSHSYSFEYEFVEEE